MHALLPIQNEVSHWCWIESIAADRDVLVPVSPGAIACLALGLELAGIEHELASKSWLCLGEGSLEALDNHFPLPPEDSSRRASSLRMLARLEHRDMANLLAEPSIRFWIGKRRIHILCADHRVDRLRQNFAVFWNEQLCVHPVYRDRWDSLKQGDWLSLLAGVASADVLFWHIGSLALLEHWHRAFVSVKLDLRCLEASALPPIAEAQAALANARLLAPHQRIIERARQLGYFGGATVAVGSDALLMALSVS